MCPARSLPAFTALLLLLPASLVAAVCATPPAAAAPSTCTAGPQAAASGSCAFDAASAEALADPGPECAAEGAAGGIDYGALLQQLSQAAAAGGLRGLPLMREAERLSYELYRTHPAFSQGRDALGASPGSRQRVEDAVVRFIWTGIEPPTPEFHAVYNVSSMVQRMRGRLLRLALTQLDSGLQALDVAAIVGACRVMDSYDAFFLEWIEAMQGPEARALAAALAAEGPLPAKLAQWYTVLVGTGPGNVTQVPYATYFARSLGPVLQAMDAWIAGVEAAEAGSGRADDKAAMLTWLRKYRECLGAEDLSRLDPCWTRLDELWMQLRGWVHPLHDQNCCYLDAFRSKVMPEFSLWLRDPGYEAEMRTMEQLKTALKAFYTARGTPLAAQGLAALDRGLSAIYYVPVSGAAFLYFRPTAMSQPNRADVKSEFGVKELYDPVAMAGRDVAARQYAAQVLADPSLVDACMDATEAIVWQVTGHELGHAVYSLLAVEGLPSDVASLMEEGRADLTSLHLLLLMWRSGQVTQHDAERYACGWLLGGTRRFAQWGAAALEGYAKSVALQWAQAARVGLAAVDPQSGRVALDMSKARVWLESLSAIFLDILSAEDAPGSVAQLTALWRDHFEAAANSSIVTHLVAALAPRPAASPGLAAKDS